MIQAVELTIRNRLLINVQPADVVGLQASLSLLVGASQYESAIRQADSGGNGYGSDPMPRVLVLNEPPRSRP